MSVGLDIGSKTVKFVELEPAGNVWRLRASGIVGYSGKSPAELEDETEIANLAEIVKKLHKEAGVSSRDVAIALPEPSVFTRTIKFPPLTDAEIDSAVKWESEQYIPIPVAEAIVQYTVIERTEGGTKPGVSVLLVAAPRKLVDKYLKILQVAGLNAVGVETELMALVRALAPVKGISLVVDFGAKSTNIAISKNGSLVFSRSIPTAGEAFTRAVAANLGISFQQAEEYKKTYGLSGKQLEGKIKIAIEPLFRVLTDEIKKAIHFYQTEEGGEPPAQVIIAGGTSSMPGAISVLTKNLGLEVVLGNPFGKISLENKALQKISPYSPYYAVAIGLALRGEGG